MADETRMTPAAGSGGAPSAGGDARGGSRERGGRDDREGGQRRGRFGVRTPRFCPFCKSKVKTIDYKQADQLRRYVTERGKIKARRKIGTCARHQRMLSTSIKRARHIALLPFTTQHVRGD
jgi:small subunit ribosomal protein S18